MFLADLHTVSLNPPKFLTSSSPLLHSIFTPLSADHQQDSFHPHPTPDPHPIFTRPSPDSAIYNPYLSDMSQSSGEICVNPYHYERLSHSNHGRMQYFRDDGSDNEQQPEKLILVLDDNEPDDINNDEK